MTSALATFSYIAWDAVCLGLIATALLVGFAFWVRPGEHEDEHTRDLITICLIIVPVGWWLSWVPIGLGLLIIEWWRAA